MSTQDQLIADIQAFLQQSGMTEWAFGTAVAKDGKFVRRVREGGSVTLPTLDRVKAYITEQRAMRGLPQSAQGAADTREQAPEPAPDRSADAEKQDAA